MNYCHNLFFIILTLGVSISLESMHRPSLPTARVPKSVSSTRSLRASISMQPEAQINRGYHRVQITSTKKLIKISKPELALKELIPAMVERKKLPWDDNEILLVDSTVNKEHMKQHCMDVLKEYEPDILSIVRSKIALQHPADSPKASSRIPLDSAIRMIPWLMPALNVLNVRTRAFPTKPLSKNLKQLIVKTAQNCGINTLFLRISQSDVPHNWASNDWGIVKELVICPRSESYPQEFIKSILAHECGHLFFKDKHMHIALGLSSNAEETYAPYLTFQEARADVFAHMQNCQYSAGLTNYLKWLHARDCKILGKDYESQQSEIKDIHPNTSDRIQLGKFFRAWYYPGLLIEPITFNYTPC